MRRLCFGTDYIADEKSWRLRQFEVESKEARALALVAYDVLKRTINSLGELRGQWYDA